MLIENKTDMQELIKRVEEQLKNNWPVSAEDIKILIDHSKSLFK